VPYSLSGAALGGESASGNRGVKAAVAQNAICGRR